MSTALTTLINRNKKSIWALLVLIASVPFNAFALGFGKPSVESALGEPLRIVLPLTALEPNEIDELVARLASPSWFQLSGLDYGEINDQLIVSVNPNLSAVVISTQQPVSQVVVPLVIELEGPRKVMRKQFTVLINPSTYEEAVASSSRVNLPSGLSLVEGVTGNIDATAGSTGLTPQAEIESDTLGAAGAGVTATPSGSGGQSLPAQADRVIVARGDSLSTIVDRFLPQGANRFQGRMAFYNVNTSAFPDGNIHTLTQGAELIVPPAQDILALPAAQARRDYQSLAQQPIPAELLAASVGAEEDSGSANNAAGASVVSSEALENVDTADPKTTTEQQDGDFRLSLLELDESESLETEAASEDDTEKSTEAAVTDESLALSTETAGEPFEMQGFTMKLSVMNAYIVELQEENEELKSRVEALEKQVQALIARDSGQEGALASVTSSIAATSADAEADAEEGSPILQEAATDTQETIEEVLAGEEQDLAAVLETSPTLLDLEDSADQATVEEDTLDGMQESPTSSVSDTEVVADETALAEIEQTSVENVIDDLTKDPAAASDVSPSVDEMLAELDAELKESESNIAQIENDLDTISDANSEPETDSATQEVANEQIARNTLDSGDAQQLQPQDTFRQDLLNKAKNLFARFNGPISQLLVAVLLLAGLLFAWMVRRGKKKDSIEDSQPDMSTYASQANNNVGVTYTPDNQLSLLEDDEDEQWMSQPDVNMENIDSLDGADVDLITQSEVYLTYNRPMQAVQALMEEYAKPDTDKFVVGSRLIKVFEKIGSSEERNTAMRSFIVTLNNDIEEFTNSEWDALRFDLDALRRQEQSSAVEKEEEPSLDMNSFNPTLEPDNDKGLGSLSLDESSIDLDFHKIDKSG